MLQLVNKNDNSDAGMEHVVQEIFTIDFIDVAVVVVGPIRRPGLCQLPRVATVHHYRLRNIHHLFTLHTEMVLAAEVGTELVIGNASAAITRVLVAFAIVALSRAMIIIHRALLLGRALFALLLLLG